MSLGSLKNLFTALQAAPALQGVSVVYGEENEFAQEYPLPLVVIIPEGGPFAPGQGYIKGVSQSVPVIWTVNESINIAIWAASSDPAAQAAIDHADATENTAALVLQALNTQRPSGLMYKPAARRWATFGGALSQYGRALVLSVAVQIPIPASSPPTATVTSVEIDESITA
jgi:hypothetical protein